MSWQITKKSVLVPFDYSPACKRALHVARTFVEDDAAVVALHVVFPPAPTHPSVLWSDMDSETLRAQAHSALADAVRREGIGAEVVTRIGAPARTIVDYARNIGAELIVIPSHGRRGLDRWLLGSVAERVVRLAEVPVLVLRTEASELEQADVSQANVA